jgi:carbamoyltransferase
MLICFLFLGSSMTVVIGFNWPDWHDNAVGVIINGELVFASEEERWTRHKHSPEELPINALRQALQFLKRRYGIKPKDIDAYAVNWDPRLMASLLRRELALISFTSFVKSRIRIDLFDIFRGWSC